MTGAPLYSPAILRLATQSGAFPFIADAPFVAEARSPVCGSALTLGAIADGDRIARVGLTLNGCAIGQAAATLFAQAAPGRPFAAMAAVRDAVSHWLAAGGAEPWPGFSVLAHVRDYPARQGAVLLPFIAAARLTAPTMTANSG